MTRARNDYASGGATPAGYQGFDPDLPIAGFYRMKLVTGGIYVGVRLWHGPPHDPDTGEEMDRSHRWQATANGRPIPLERAWPRCADAPINSGEYAYLLSLQEWGKENGHAAVADPRKKLDPLTTPLMF